MKAFKAYTSKARLIRAPFQKNRSFFFRVTRLPCIIHSTYHFDIQGKRGECHPNRSLCSITLHDLRAVPLADHKPVPLPWDRPFYRLLGWFRCWRNRSSLHLPLGFGSNQACLSGQYISYCKITAGIHFSAPAYSRDNMAYRCHLPLKTRPQQVMSSRSFFFCTRAEEKGPRDRLSLPISGYQLYTSWTFLFSVIDKLVMN